MDQMHHSSSPYLFVNKHVSLNPSLQNATFSDGIYWIEYQGSFRLNQYIHKAFEITRVVQFLFVCVLETDLNARILFKNHLDRILRIPNHRPTPTFHRLGERSSIEATWFSSALLPVKKGSCPKLPQSGSPTAL